MSTQTDIIKMLKRGDTYKRIQKTLMVSSKTISKANLVLKAQLKMASRLESERKALSTTLSTIGTKKPVVKGLPKKRKASLSTLSQSLSFIHVNQFKTWLMGLDRSKYHDSSLSAIKRLLDHKRMAFLEGYVALMNEYLEGL